MSAQARSHADGPVRSRVPSGGANVLWTGTISSRRGVKGVAEWRIREQEEKENRTESWMRQGGAGRSYGPTGGNESHGTTEQDKMSLCHKGARGNEEG